MRRSESTKFLNLMGVALLVVSCIQVGGCGDDGASKAPDGVRVEVSFEVVPKKSYDHVYAEVYLDDEIVGNVGNRQSIQFEVPPGPHRIRLEADDYQPEEKSVKIIDTSKQEFYFRLSETQ